jgi:SSS family solute:Na+ symporter
MPESVEVLRETNFSVIDWVIVILYPLLSLAIGIYVARFIRNMSDFVVAGHGLGVCLGIATMTGTELGLITVMYSAQKGFTGGFAAFHIALAAGLVTFLVGVSGFLVYRLRAMKVLTIPEFYEKRFDRKTRILGGIMMALGGILNMGLFLQVGSRFIVGITGLSHESWALPTVMVFLISLVLAYTCLGGMISVVIADYVQFVVLSFGLLLTCFLAVGNLGWTNIVQTVDTHMGRGGFDPTVAESGFGWEYIIWMGFLGLVSCGIWPTSVARALAMDSPQAVKRQYMFSSVSFLIRFLIPYFWGICAFVFIMQNESLQEVFFPAGYPPPDELPEGVKAMNNLYGMPLFLGRILPAGIIGIITAGMVAAFMSTHDSYLLCWSSVLTQDVIAPIYKSIGQDLDTKTRIRLSREIIVLVGLYVLWWGLIYEGRDDIWDYMAVTGAIYFTGAFALLLGGLYWKGASSTGAFLALLMGMTALLGLSPIQDLLGIDIPSERVGLMSIGVTLAALVAGSLCFPDKPSPRQSLPPVTTTSQGLVVGVLVTAAMLLIVVALVAVAYFDMWQQLWTVVLIGGVGLFGVLAIVVTLGGFIDVLKLIKRLRQSRTDED